MTNLRPWQHVSPATTEHSQYSTSTISTSCAHNFEFWWFGCLGQQSKMLSPVTTVSICSAGISPATAPDWVTVLQAVAMKGFGEPCVVQGDSLGCLTLLLKPNT